MEDLPLDPEILTTLARMTMPFGKYKGTILVDLPEEYVVWFKQKGFPEGKIGELLSLLYEIKRYGMEELLTPLKR